MKHLPRRVLFALLTVYIVWGSTYFAIHIALASFPPFLLMGTRFLVAGAILYTWQKWRGSPNPSALEWRDAGVIGVLMLGGGMGLTAAGQQYISSGLTAVFIACSPMILSFCTGFFGVWPNKREWLGIIIGFAGAILLAAGGDFSAQPIGVAALLGAILCWDVGSVLSQRKLTLAPGGMGFASEMLLGGVFLIAVALVKGENFSAPMTAAAFAAWSYLVVAGSLLAFTAYMFLLARVSPALASSYAYVNPLIAVTLGVMLGGEELGPREMVAMAIILGSVVLLTVSRSATPSDK
ncbi:MAG: drug/metabolite exporter YedA [Cytophaga sp.]|nr:drug/metabolite exporter YedA [Undibacterium sp.]